MSLTDASRVSLIAMLLLLQGCSWLTGKSSGQAVEAVGAVQQSRLEETFSRAVALLEASEAESARALFAEILEERPHAAGALLNLGIIAQQEGHLDLAGNYFDQVLELQPSHVQALNRSAVLAREQGQFELARSLYRKALAVRPDYAPALLNLAILMDIYLGQPGEALPYYEHYGEVSEHPDPRLEDWLFDARNRAME